MKAAQRRVSFTDLQQMPDDGRRYELYDGELSVVPSPIPRHQVVVDNLKTLLREHIARHGGLALVSPIDIVFSEYNVVQPDIVFFAQARRHVINFDEAIRSRPDLAIEVLSPSTSGNDRGRKMEMFARYGVPECWIADPALACLEIRMLAAGAYTLVQTACGDDEIQSPLLSDLTFPASVAFRLP